MALTKVSAALNLDNVKGSDISSATTITIPIDAGYFDVTGTTTITGMTVASSRYFTLQFDGAVILTNGSALKTHVAANYTTVAGDRFVFFATAANTVEVVSFVSAGGITYIPPQANDVTPGLRIGNNASQITGITQNSSATNRMSFISQGIIGAFLTGGSFAARNFNSDGGITIADDAVFPIYKGDGGLNFDGSWSMLLNTNATTTFALIYGRITSPECIVMAQSSNVVEAGTHADAVVYTDATDAKFSVISCAATSTIYLVNRRGSSVSCSYTMFGAGVGPIQVGGD